MNRSDKIGFVAAFVLALAMAIFMLWPRKPAPPSGKLPPPPAVGAAGVKVDAAGNYAPASSKAVDGSSRQVEAVTGAEQKQAAAAVSSSLVALDDGEPYIE